MSDQIGQPAHPKAPLDPIFPRFFKDGEDSGQKLLGLIAYGLYEEARREWADDFRAREGRYPSEEELRAYERSWTGSRLDGLKNAAIQILASYADTIATQVETQALRGALRGGFFRDIGRWLLSAVVFVLAALGLVIALSRSGVDLAEIFHSLARPPG
jgi:hypothetical protein